MSPNAPDLGACYREYVLSTVVQRGLLNRKARCLGY